MVVDRLPEDLQTMMVEFLNVSNIIALGLVNKSYTFFNAFIIEKYVEKNGTNTLLSYRKHQHGVIIYQKGIICHDVLPLRELCLLLKTKYDAERLEIDVVLYECIHANRPFEYFKTIAEIFDINLNESYVGDIFDEQEFMIHIAAYNDNTQILSYLIQRGVNIDTVSFAEKETPLMYAVSNNSFKSAKMLIEHGCNINAKNYLGFSPLHQAIYTQSDKNITDLLIRNKCDINGRSLMSETPLTLGIFEENYNVVKYLLENKADANDKVIPPIHVLLITKQPATLKMLKLLISHGADVRQTYRGQTVLYRSKQTKQHEKVVKYLKYILNKNK
jgi:hypothetical protein